MTLFLLALLPVTERPVEGLFGRLIYRTEKVGFGSIGGKENLSVLTEFLTGGILWLVPQNEMRRTILVVGEHLKALFDPSAMETLRQGGIELEELDNPHSVKSFLAKRDDALVIAPSRNIAQAVKEELASTHRHFLKVILNTTLIQVLQDKPELLQEFLKPKEIDLLRKFLFSRSRGLAQEPISATTPEASALPKTPTPPKETTAPGLEKSGPVKPPEVTMSIKKMVVDFLAFRFPPGMETKESEPVQPPFDCKVNLENIRRFLAMEF